MGAFGALVAPSIDQETPIHLRCTFPVDGSGLQETSDLPEHYDDCPTAGLKADDNIVELSFGTFKAPLIEAGRDYYGYWSFNNHRGGATSTEVRLYGAEGEYKRGSQVNFECPLLNTPLTPWKGNNWCVGSIDAHKLSLFSEATDTDDDADVATTWTYGAPSYVKFPED